MQKYLNRGNVEAPCRAHCPAGTDIPRVSRLISQGKSAEALAVIRNSNPFPSVCGRVCFHPCEEACKATHNYVGGPVAIKGLERFVADQVSTSRQSPPASLSNKRVAVVGSGPAGLTAAYYLMKLGHTVTVLEALPVVGGMMRVGIPEYRLPKGVLEKEIGHVTGIGFEIKTNTRVDSLERLLGEGYDAVLLAIGAHSGVKLEVEGSDRPQVTDGVSFLRDISLGKEVGLGKKVVVVGGGNVAFDCARSALRLGAHEVRVACLEPRNGLVASPDEIRQGGEEGVIIHPLHTFSRIVTDDGHVTGVEFLDVRSFEFDSDGQVHIDSIKGSEHVLSADMIIFAIGQLPDLGLVEGVDAIEVTKRELLGVDPVTLATGMNGVFAAGDAVTGPASVIEAIAGGRKATVSIDKFLGGSGTIVDIPVPPSEELPPLITGMPIGNQTTMPTLPSKERLSGFAEVELGFNQAMAIREANRCLWCDLPVWADPMKCVGCLVCALMCSVRFEGAANPVKGKIEIVPPDRSTTLGEAVVAFAEDCDGCGICIRACAYGAIARQNSLQPALRKTQKYCWGGE